MQIEQAREMFAAKAVEAGIAESRLHFADGPGDTPTACYMSVLDRPYEEWVKACARYSAREVTDVGCLVSTTDADEHASEKIAALVNAGSKMVNIHANV